MDIDGLCLPGLTLDTNNGFTAWLAPVSTPGTVALAVEECPSTRSRLATNIVQAVLRLTMDAWHGASSLGRIDGVEADPSRFSAASPARRILL